MSQSQEDVSLGRAGELMLRRGLTLGWVVLAMGISLFAIAVILLTLRHFFAHCSANSGHVNQPGSSSTEGPSKGEDNSHAAGGKGSKNPPKPIRVYVVKPQAGGPERKVTRPGTIHAFQHADLFAKEEGYLRNQKVDIGDEVKKDQPLAEIFAPEFAANVDKAEAELKKARSLVDVMQSREQSAAAELSESKAKIEQSQADLETAEAMVELRRKQYKRFKTLVESNAIQQELLDEKLESQKAAEATERSSRVAVMSARAAELSAAAHLQAAMADVEDAKAFVVVAEANLRRENVYLSYTIIRAPFGGVITRRTYHEGDFILKSSGNGNQPILSIAVTDVMRVIIDVPDSEVPYTHRGVSADISVDTLEGKVFTGKVARMSYLEDYKSLTMRTEIDLQNSNHELVDGMFCSITLHLGRNRRTLRVPSSCLVGKEHDGKREVFVVRDQKAHKTDVKVGIEDGVTTEILSGLNVDDDVINGHGAALEDGVSVQVDRQPSDSQHEDSNEPKHSASTNHNSPQTKE